jgi:predicted translin family RNA/ssDNA-binding protein
MTILISVYHIIGVMVGLIAIFGAGFKILHLKLKAAWLKDIKQLKESDDLKRQWKEDIKKVFDDVERDCPQKIKNAVDGKFSLVTKDINQVQDTLQELKEILRAQQETLIAIQVAVADIKPRLDNLEKRVDKLETNR